MGESDKGQETRDKKQETGPGGLIMLAPGETLGKQETRDKRQETRNKRQGTRNK